ncbi:transcriptional regulator [Pararhizobium mangrovi]|uniref:Transcriptional regulator n=1 Tax=Pararhizobium mangrovi TaxID=2590452 RepID=A0A506TWM2_9HYPH|nr:transcriptional regulator [Pararhizobium mangrovi]TPW25890.1 transcriptional regulator [Pararhizobium mangrovi]
MSREFPVNDNEDAEPVVFILTGRAHRESDDEGTEIHILISAADEDSAVRESLNALSEQGYTRAELDRIGTVDEMPEEEPHASAYQGATEGEVAIVTFED